MNRLALAIALLASMALGVDLLASGVGGGMPFVVDYQPKHYALYTVAGIAYVFACGAIASHLGRHREWFLACLGLVLAGGLIAFGMYTGTHPQPIVQGWDAPEPVTAFHVQLVVPFLIASVGGVLAALASLCTESRSRGQTAAGDSGHSSGPLSLSFPAARYSSRTARSR